MIEDGVAYRESGVTGEASYRSSDVKAGDSEAQGETQGGAKRCEVADDPVVVLKFWPMKAGNRLEEKTETTGCPGTTGAGVRQKPCRLRRGEVYLKSLRFLLEAVASSPNRPSGRGTLSAVRLDRQAADFDRSTE